MARELNYSALKPTYAKPLQTDHARNYPEAQCHLAPQDPGRGAGHGHADRGVAAVARELQALRVDAAAGAVGGEERAAAARGLACRVWGGAGC